METHYKGLDLILIECKDGFSYEWQDGHGKIWCSGWLPGTKRYVHEAALYQIKSIHKINSPKNFF